MNRKRGEKLYRRSLTIKKGKETERNVMPSHLRACRSKKGALRDGGIAMHPESREKDGGLVFPTDCKKFLFDFRGKAPLFGETQI